MARWETCEIPKRGEPGRTCGNIGRNPTQGIRVCRMHLRMLQRATPLESWMIRNGIACPRHARATLVRQGDRMACQARVSGGGINPNIRLCSFSVELPEQLREPEKQQAGGKE